MRTTAHTPGDTVLAVRRANAPLKVRIALALVTVFSGALALAACNTTEGAGKDIKAAGQGIEDAAKDAKH